ncbi:amino acid kinase family protein [Aeoliella sp. SH292]|uniref:amino acid kinase family protein n=1 Tax=Aeoliella sp. SH292 TaxID=3454464 RepID=UPI003F9842C2
MASPEIVVVKVGGSLLERPDLLRALGAWLSGLDSQSHQVLVVGGGPAVDGLRRLNDILQLEDHDTHWQAIRLMQLAGRAVGSRAPWPSIEDWGQLVRRCGSPGTTQFLAESFLRELEPRLAGTRLPVGWQVTSDSIAARIAVCLGAKRLVLLKSRPATLPEQHDWDLAARQGLVDEFFPPLATAIPQVECQVLPTVISRKASS